MPRVNCKALFDSNDYNFDMNLSQALKGSILLTNLRKYILLVTSLEGVKLTLYNRCLGSKLNVFWLNLNEIDCSQDDFLMTF